MPDMNLLQWGRTARRPLLSHSLEDTQATIARKQAVGEKMQADAAATNLATETTQQLQGHMAGAVAGDPRAGAAVQALDPQTYNLIQDGFEKRDANQQVQMVQRAKMALTEIQQMDDQTFQQKYPNKTKQQVQGEAQAIIGMWEDAADEPAEVREHKYYLGLPDDAARAEYLRRSRKVQYLNQGNQWQGMDESTGGVASTAPLPISLKPGEEPEVRGRQAEAAGEGSAIGTGIGAARVELAEMEARLPRLHDVTAELSALGKVATYTHTGQSIDFIRREFGMDAAKGAVARTEYISKVDNEILPLLRITFGAQFTVEEGKALKATLGDPDKSPAEKDAVLRSFIDNKVAEIKSKQRTLDNLNAASGKPQKSGIKFRGFK